MDKPNNNDDPSEKIHFNSQAISDLSQLSIAVAIGLFGILAINLAIDEVLEFHKGLLTYNLTTTWTWDLWSKITLSLAYFGLVIVGAVCILAHKFYSLVNEKYIDTRYKDYIDDLGEIASANWFLKKFNLFWINYTGNTKKSLNLVLLTLLPYLVISCLLWASIVLI